MSAEPVPAAPADDVCPLCGASTAAAAARCSSCGMTLAGVGGRPGPFTRGTLWLWAGLLLAIYVVVLAVVATVPD